MISRNSSYERVLQKVKNRKIIVIGINSTILSINNVKDNVYSLLILNIFKFF